MNSRFRFRLTTMTDDGLLPVVWPLGPAVCRADIPDLCDQLSVVVHYGGVRLVLCDVSGVILHDAVLVEALLRLQLTARRFGGRIRVFRPSPQLLDLITATGLGTVLTAEPP
jgi:anti-anti-sigma regulatory factor